MAHQVLRQPNTQATSTCRVMTTAGLQNVNQEEDEMKGGFGLAHHLRAGDDHVWLVVRIPS